MEVLFTAWGYGVTYLETAAVVVALIGVSLAIKGTRWAWPFYLVSGVLYGLLFWNVELIASAALQLVFIVAAIWGWFDWGAQGVVRSNTLTTRKRIVGAVVLLVAWLVLAPLLRVIGGAATWLDAFVFVGSLAAQVLMVLGYLEAWPMWVIVNMVGVVHYAQQSLWFTAIFYSVLLLMAIWGWRAWFDRNRESQPQPTAAALASGS